MDHKKFQLIFFVTITLLAAALVFFIFLPYLAPLVLAGTIAIVFRPVQTWLTKQMKLPDWVAALITLIISLVVVLVPLIFFGTVVLEESKELYVRLASIGSGSLSTRISQFIELHYPRLAPSLVPQIAGYVREATSWLISHLGPLFSGIAQGVLQFFIGLLALYYFLKDGDKFKKILATISPLADTYDQEIFTKIENTVNSTIRGSLVVAIVQGLLAGIGYAIFGVPTPALWGTVSIIAALIPMIGTSLVTVPAVLYLLAIGHTGAGVGLAIWAAVLVGLIDNVLRPKLLERGIHIHPFIILISVIGGIEFFGPVGFVLGPVILSLFGALVNMSGKQIREFRSKG